MFSYRYELSVMLNCKSVNFPKGDISMKLTGLYAKNLVLGLAFLGAVGGNTALVYPSAEAQDTVLSNERIKDSLPSKPVIIKTVLKEIVFESRSSTVNLFLVNSVIKSGVKEGQVVRNVQDLYPMNAGRAMLATKNWNKLSSINPHVETYELTGNKNIGAQYVEFNIKTGETKLITKSYNNGQDIVMDAQGNVVSNTGIYPIERV